MSCWLQITAGQGPSECAWVVPRVLRCFCGEAQRVGIGVTLLHSVARRESGTLDSVLTAVDGPGLAAFLATWTGTVLWIGKSPFRANYKRRNWFVGVNALSVPENPAWSMKEIEISFLCAGGPGGQHVNKTESAVRIRHVPTGLVVVGREERSQHANRKLAFARLAEALTQKSGAAAQHVERQRWAQHQSLERGNPVRVYTGTEFTLESSG